MREKAEKTAEQRLFNKNKWLFSVGGIGRDMVYCIVSSYLLTYVQFGIQLTAAQYSVLALAIGVLGRVWDAVNDPMMGAIIDGTHMKWGKFKPWIFIGAVLCGVLTFLMFNVRPTGWAFVATLIALYLVWETVFTMNDIGYWSMIPSLSRTGDERSTLTTMTVFFAGVGGLIMNGLVSFFSPGNVRDGYAMFAFIAMVAIIAFQSMTAFGVKEAPRLDAEKNEKVSLKNMIKTLKGNDQILWMSLVALFYNVGNGLLGALGYNLYYLEIGYDGGMFTFILIFGIGGQLVQMLYPTLAKKFGRKKLQAVSISVACFGYLLVAFLGWSKLFPFTLINFIVIGCFIFIGQSLYYISTLVNMSICVEYNEYKTGRRNEAVISTVRPFMAKFSDALKYGIVTLIVIVSGVYGLSNSVSALETQVSSFSKDHTSGSVGIVAAQSYYVDEIAGFAIELEGASDAEKQAKIGDIQKRIDSDKWLSGYEIDAKYVEALSETHVYEDGEEIGKLADLTDYNFKQGSTYTLQLSGEYVEDGVTKSFNVANANFKDKADVKTRILLRVAVSVVPIVLLLASLLIMRKKYIIDEEYFDMMMTEIQKRESEQQADIAN